MKIKTKHFVVTTIDGEIYKIVKAKSKVEARQKYKKYTDTTLVSIKEYLKFTEVKII